MVGLHSRDLVLTYRSRCCAKAARPVPWVVPTTGDRETCGMWPLDQDEAYSLWLEKRWIQSSLTPPGAYRMDPQRGQ